MTSRDVTEAPAAPVAAAEAYARHAGRYADELADAFVRFADVTPDMRTLDVGCGPGALALRLAAIVGPERVAAADPSAAYVEACRRRLPGADVRVAAAEELPFEDAAFEVVLAQLVVQVLDDPPGAVRELTRVAAPGGIVATCVWDSRNGMPLLEAFFDSARAVDPEGAWRAGSDQENPWCTRDGLHELWAGGGLDGVETTELWATARYENGDDAWWSFGAGVGMTGSYCRSLPGDRRAALREEFIRRLGAPSTPFELTARAWAVRGRAPGAAGDPRCGPPVTTDLPS